MYCLKTTAAAIALATFTLPLHAQETETDGMTDVLPLEQEARSASETALQDTLYDLIALQHTTHQYHWNVVGTDFYQLHEFYGELYEGVGGFIDPTAERLLAIGVAADGSLTGAAQGSDLPEQAPVEFVAGESATGALLPIYAEFSSDLYDRIEATSDDPPTQDFLIGIAYAVDKYTWQLRAHTQNGASVSSGGTEGDAQQDDAPATDQ